LQQCLPFTVLKPVLLHRGGANNYTWLQQYLPFTVCAEGGEAAEERRDDEVRTSQVPEVTIYAGFTDKILPIVYGIETLCL
jgi:hypothetical protein